MMGEVKVMLEIASPAKTAGFLPKTGGDSAMTNMRSPSPMSQIHFLNSPIPTRVTVF